MHTPLQYAAAPVAEQPTTAPMQPITVSNESFKQLTGLNERKVYRLIAARDLESFRVGKRRLILLSSYYAYLERVRAEQARYFANSPVRESPG